MKDLLQKLQECYEGLSNGQKKVAKIFFEDPSKIAFSSAIEIGKDVGVSESTVIRLTQKLGYKGYAEVQELVQKDVVGQRVLTQYKETSSINNKSFWNDLMDADVTNIQNLKNNLDEDTFLKVVKTISNGQHIYITGNLLSYGLAHFFSQSMNMILGNTELLISGDVHYYQQLSKVKPGDVLLAIILPRYMKSTMETVQYMKKAGASIIAITDSELSPVWKYADISIKVPINSSIKIDSYTAVLSLLTSIMRAVSIQDQCNVKKNLKLLEKTYQENNVFYQEK